MTMYQRAYDDLEKLTSQVSMWKWLFIGSMITLFVTVFGFVSAAVVWYG